MHVTWLRFPRTSRQPVEGATLSLFLPSPESINLIQFIHSYITFCFTDTSLQNNPAILSSSSCSLVDTIDSEPVDRQSRSSSPDLLEQPDKDEHAQEHTTELEQLLDAPIPTKGSKKKKKGWFANQTSISHRTPGWVSYGTRNIRLRIAIWPLDGFPIVSRKSSPLLEIYLNGGAFRSSYVWSDMITR